MQSNFENFLDPNILKNHLIFLSLFIAAFELTKDIIISKPKDFFMIGFEDGEWITSPNYKTAVLCRNKSPLYASLDWFKEQSAITQDDINLFTKIKNSRNEAVHEILAVIGNGPTEKFKQDFTNLINLLTKIERWWFAEIELPLTDLDPNNVDLDGVMPGSVLTIKMLEEVAYGDEEKRKEYFDEFQQNMRDK